MTLPILVRLFGLFMRAFEWFKRNRWASSRASPKHRLALYLMFALIVVFVYFLFMTEQAYWLDDRTRTACLPVIQP